MLKNYCKLVDIYKKYILRNNVKCKDTVCIYFLDKKDAKIPFQKCLGCFSTEFRAAIVAFSVTQDRKFFLLFDKC